jgi:uncharacterized protein YceH (UPF0502 family)
MKKESKSNSEKIMKIWKKKVSRIMKRYGKYGGKASRIEKRPEKYGKQVCNSEMIWKI